MDGVGEWATATIGKAESVDGRHSLEILHEIDFPHSLGLFYSAMTDLLGFEVNEGEYKVMGMAPYGEPRFLDELERVFRTYDDGSFWLDMSYFSFHYSNRKAYTAKLPALLGVEPRTRDERFWTEHDPRRPRATWPAVGGMPTLPPASRSSPSARSSTWHGRRTARPARRTSASPAASP